MLLILKLLLHYLSYIKHATNIEITASLLKLHCAVVVTAFFLENGDKLVDLFSEIKL